MIGIMMEENNSIFLADGDTQLFLVEPLYKKYSTTFVWGHPFSTYEYYDHFSIPLPLYAPVDILDDPRPSIMDTFIMNCLFLNNIQISHSLKYKH